MAASRVRSRLGRPALQPRAGSRQDDGRNLGHSQAVLADALHSLTDSVTDVAVILGVRYWTAPADEDHPHGHGRIETLITLVIGSPWAESRSAWGRRRFAGCGTGRE